MSSVLLQVALVDFQIGKLLHFGNVASFSLATPRIITPGDKICTYWTMQCPLILDIHMSHVTKTPVL